jgi:hypothetical protein
MVRFFSGFFGSLGELYHRDPGASVTACNSFLLWVNGEIPLDPPFLRSLESPFDGYTFMVIRSFIITGEKHRRCDQILSLQKPQNKEYMELPLENYHEKNDP